MLPISRSFAVWLVSISLLLNGLMPLVAQAIVKAQPAAMPLCSTSQHVRPDAPAPAAAVHMDCVYCCTGTGTPILPENRPESPFISATPVRAKPSVAALLRAQSRPGDAQARAPPA